MKYLNYFVGASGTGKTTLINFINANFNVSAKEVSARPYLPTTGSYDQTLTDDIQAVIVHSRTIEVLADLLKMQDYRTKIPFIYSRSPIDNLAYQQVLKKGEFMDKTVRKEIEAVKDHATFFYLPIEFPLATNDEVRGLNEVVRINTDNCIINILKEYNIDYITLSGTVEERTIILSNHFDKFSKI